MFLLDVAQAFKARKIPFAVAGGYAVALHGAVRATVDIDLVILLNQKNLILAEETLNTLNLQSRIPISAKDVFQFRKEYIEKRNLIAWSFVNSKNPIQVVDILITQSLSDFDVQNVNVGREKVPVIGLKDLIEMKIKSGRPKDLMDVESLKEIWNEKKEES